MSSVIAAYPNNGESFLSPEYHSKSIKVLWAVQGPHRLQATLLGDQFS